MTSLPELPLTPVSAQSASKALHGPDGSELCDHEEPLKCSMSGVPVSSPTDHTLLAEMAVTELSVANETLAFDVNDGLVTVHGVDAFATPGMVASTAAVATAACAMLWRWISSELPALLLCGGLELHLWYVKRPAQVQAATQIA